MCKWSSTTTPGQAAGATWKCDSQNSLSIQVTHQREQVLLRIIPRSYFHHPPFAMYWCQGHLNFTHPHLSFASAVRWRHPVLQMLLGECASPSCFHPPPTAAPSNTCPQQGWIPRDKPGTHRLYGSGTLITGGGNLPLPWQWACRDEHFFLWTAIRSLKQCCRLPKVISAMRKQSWAKPWENKRAGGKLASAADPSPLRLRAVRGDRFLPLCSRPWHKSNQIQPPFLQQSSR